MLMFLSRKFEFPIIELICINKWFFLVFPHQKKNASRIEKNGHGNEKRNDKSGIIVVEMVSIVGKFCAFSSNKGNSKSIKICMKYI